MRSICIKSFFCLQHCRIKLFSFFIRDKSLSLKCYLLFQFHAIELIKITIGMAFLTFINHTIIIVERSKNISISNECLSPTNGCSGEKGGVVVALYHCAFAPGIAQMNRGLIPHSGLDTITL